MLNRGRPLLVLAISTILVGTLLSILVAWLIGAHGISYWWLAPTLMLNGLGMGVVGSANQTLSMMDIPLQHGGTAGGFKQTVERITTALGNAVITGIFFAVVAQGSWANGVVLAFSAIVVCLLGAVALAVMDLRQHAR